MCLWFSRAAPLLRREFLGILPRLAPISSNSGRRLGLDCDRLLGIEQVHRKRGRDRNELHLHVRKRRRHDGIHLRSRLRSPLRIGCLQRRVVCRSRLALGRLSGEHRERQRLRDQRGLRGLDHQLQLSIRAVHGRDHDDRLRGELLQRIRGTSCLGTPRKLTVPAVDSTAVTPAAVTKIMATSMAGAACIIYSAYISSVSLGSGGSGANWRVTGSWTDSFGAANLVELFFDPSSGDFLSSDCLEGSCDGSPVDAGPGCTPSASCGQSGAACSQNSDCCNCTCYLFTGAKCM